MRLEGKVALVTAAGRGIGRGIALALAEEGADLIVNSFSEETTEATAEAARALGREVLAVPADATEADAIVRMVEQAGRRFGRIDILVNNVGAAPRTGIPQGDGPLAPVAALWDALYAQNLRSVMLMCEAVVPHLVERKSGRIVNISSIAGRTSLSATLLSTLVHPSYGAMKAALINYTQTLAEQLGEHGINVNAVCPGIVYTDAWATNAERAVKMFPQFRGMDPKTWFDGISRGDYPEIFDRTPLKRPQTVEDVARAVVFLASDDARNITGQSLMVDGGMVKV
jgi:NAD(P)-dependent dehydrogenase (short-subunit alcohol dehydrogenase family)